MLEKTLGTMLIILFGAQFAFWMFGFGPELSVFRFIIWIFCGFAGILILFGKASNQPPKI